MPRYEFTITGTFDPRLDSKVLESLVGLMSRLFGVVTYQHKEIK